MASFKVPLELFMIIISILLGMAAAVRADPPDATPEQTASDFVYTVQPGDTLALIALRFKLNLAEIALANGLVTPNLIFPGQQLVLPGIPAPATAPPQKLTSIGDRIHIVEPGETIFSVANRYGVVVRDLIVLNGLANPDLIRVGQLLQIPGGIPPASGRSGQPLFNTVHLSEATIIQGRTLVVRVSLAEAAASLQGSFAGQPVFFYEEGGHQFWGIIAIHAGAYRQPA
jgi:LysM repeat protein